MSEYAIAAEGLIKRFGKTTALDGVSLAARPGTVLGLLGPNGAGKTTLVKIFATQLRADGGAARVTGRDVTREARKVRRVIGLTGQYASVDDDLTGTENLVLIGKLLDLRATEATARAAELLDRFGLAEVASRRVKAYSGGMRRRLDLAASLVGRPAVVFLDEPTTGLDPVKRDDVWQLIRGMAAEGVTALLTTQYLEEADALADEICVIDRGKVIADGTPAELKQVINGQSIVTRPVDPGRLGEVAAIVAAVTGREPGPASRGELSVPADGDGAFAELVRHLDRAGIPMAELSLRLPSLDEVFFALTGRRAAGQDDGEGEPG